MSEQRHSAQQPIDMPPAAGAAAVSSRPGSGAGPEQHDAPPLRATIRRLRDAPRGLRVAIVAVFVLSLALRVFIALGVTPVYHSDARDYLALEHSLLEGRGYAHVYEGETEAFEGFTFRAFRPPGYPLLMAGLRALFGWSPYLYLYVNIAADLVTQACFLLIATQLLGPLAAVIVQVLLGMHVLWTPNPMTEAPYVAFFALLCLLLAFQRPLASWRGALGFGLLAAVALFTRPITVCFFPALAWRFLQRKRTARAAFLLVLCALPALVALAAWTVRNYRIFGEFVPFTTNFGHHNAWDFQIAANDEFAALRQLGLNEAQINRRLTTTVLAVARQHPVFTCETIVGRALDLFTLAPAWELRETIWPLILPAEKSPAGRLYRVLYYQYYVTYPLSGVGAIVLLLRRRRLGGLWTVVLAYAWIHGIVSNGDMRLVAPLYPIMCVMVAGLVTALRDGRGHTAST